MANPSRIDDLVLAIDMGRAAVDRQKQYLEELVGMRADPTVLAVFRMRLELSEESYAKDRAELDELSGG